jgi:CheY-like chemotaxis protein
MDARARLLRAASDSLVPPPTASRAPRSTGRSRYAVCVASNTPAPWTLRPDLSRRNMLIIEDDADSREFLREVLRRCGAVVVEADNVRTARIYIKDMKFDLIVTDLAMPGGDGAMFLNWLREQPRERGGLTPAIAVTAFYEQYPPAELTGWAAYLRKPVDIEQFIRTVADILHIPTSRA